MKRPAIGFCVCLCSVLTLGWAGEGNAKGKSNSAPADTSAAPAASDSAPAADPNAADPNAAPADANAAPAEAAPAPGTETVTPEGGDVQLEPEAIKAKPATTLSWQDIVVVPRKAFLKGGRFEFAPFSGVSVNDNLIRHYAFGGAINYYLSDAFSVGLEGQYYVKALTETEENVGLQYNRIPTLNRYKYSGALMFGYAPVYGKFALFNKQIMHWEIFANAGVGGRHRDGDPSRTSQTRASAPGTNSSASWSPSASARASSSSTGSP